MALDLEALATYPTKSDEWVKTVLIGGVLTLLSFLLLPIFLVYGYFVRVLRAGMDDAPEPPVFDDWGSMFVEGLVAFVVLFVYQLIPLIVFGLTVGSSVLAMTVGGRAGAGLGVAGLFGGLAVTFLLALVFGYLGLIGVANYAREGRFGAGFDFGVISDVALSSDYAIPWLVAVVTLLVAGVVASIPIVGVFVIFYAQIIAGKLVGEGFAAALSVQSNTGGTATATAD